ncbi:MAG: hypothetical protein UW44_C0008G0030 [Candidatus Collierbacteria bacterium GW2011_GWB2_44_22]|uniref:Uncharacterized protein n=1 Tax=Candidatus Collierbacteria bacterium GW2011_GWB2_44_22 TaxID=1618387 RepID=A0A0G1HYR4_9BACT|nr:MAG: hypothetical protein UW44_C0008G0030 [Candidatus Collierbacteria bacterium GW2011_GWB2_44_22]KKT66927.1 MAG: hypothetical protein UW58_C0001G0031 [Candidatus Collierbacteria bacterium GW2011_GWC2_44_30]
MTWLGGLVLMLVFGFALFVPKRVVANEGVINLRGTGTGGACYASSVFIDGTYKILMTCRELKIALSPEKNRYVAWVEDTVGKQKRLGEIANGKLSSITDIKFVRIFVTVESDGYGNTPSEDVLLTGFVEPINFGAGIASPPIVTPTPTPSKTVGVISPTVLKDQPTGQSGLGSALGTIFKIALLGFGILLLVVGVFSFLSRKRSL